MENNIYELRIQQGLSQEKLAELSHLSVGYICHLEKGSRKNPTSNTMIKISKALNKAVGEVFKADNLTP